VAEKDLSSYVRSTIKSTTPIFA